MAQRPHLDFQRNRKWPLGSGPVGPTGAPSGVRETHKEDRQKGLRWPDGDVTKRRDRPLLQSHPCAKAQTPRTDGRADSHTGSRLEKVGGTWPPEDELGAEAMDPKDSADM